MNPTNSMINLNKKDVKKKKKSIIILTPKKNKELRGYEENLSHSKK
jgi:hypothetical protein